MEARKRITGILHRLAALLLASALCMGIAAADSSLTATVTAIGAVESIQSVPVGSEATVTALPALMRNSLEKQGFFDNFTVKLPRFYHK